MPSLRVTDEEIIQAYAENPSIVSIASKFQMGERSLRARVARLRSKGFLTKSPDSRSPFYDPKEYPRPEVLIERYSARVSIDLKDGVILVGSDAHVWPGDNTTAQRGFVQFAKELKPSVVVVNGDVFDGARISRWPRIGWDKTPTVVEELKAVTDFLTKIEEASGSALKVWPLGNHDGRFETRLAQVAPEYEGVKNFSLKDHFPYWTPCWSLMVNGNLLIKHKWKGGKYAPANNTLNAGVSMVTGHLHSLKCWPMSDENGTRWGVDGGTLAEPISQQFINYLEDATTDWRSGFVVLTIHKGELLQPELARVHQEGEIDFRGTVVNV